MPVTQPLAAPRPLLLAAVSLGLFLVWSNSFIAIEYLLEDEPGRLDWLSLTVARFVPAALVCWGYLLARRRSETAALVRRYPWRALGCGALSVPLYNFALCFGQQQGVPAPVASLATTLAPLFILVLAGLFLGERATRATFVGLGVAAAGMAVLGLARGEVEGGGYSWAVAVIAGAPLSWAIYSVFSKSVARSASPIVWSYLTTGIGGLLVLPLLPGEVWEQWSRLQASGWAALLYLSLPCTVLGFALWTWLLRYLPATVVGLLVFLNPPLTTVSKWLLSRLAPATFDFAVTPGEWLGGAVVLAGLAVALLPRSVSGSESSQPPNRH